MVKLCFYVPESHLELVKQAVFHAGAGKIGNYDSCCWQTSGLGQFRPVEGSQPFVGQQDQLETIEEYKVEMICDEKCLSKVIKVFKESHPYEEPAFDVVKLVDL